MSACIKNETRESMLASPESLGQMATASLTLFKMAKPHYMHLRHEADKSTKNTKRNISNTRDKEKKTPTVQSGNSRLQIETTVRNVITLKDYSNLLHTFSRE